MSSVFYYEPYYDFEKLLEDAFGYQQANSGHQLQRRGPESHVASTNRPLKPRYFYPLSDIPDSHLLQDGFT